MKKFVKFGLVCLSILAWQVGAVESAELSGRVIDQTLKVGLASANVVVEGTTLGASTDLDGYFTISNIVAGVYAVCVSSIGYTDSTVQSLAVDELRENRLDIALFPTAVELSEVTIAGQAIKGSTKRGLEERFNASEITDRLMDEEIKTMPDPDVAQVVRRATGVSNMGGDLVIRGMGLRYSKVTLNNAQVAGTEPNRSGVSLELFPAGLMSQVTVNKSYLPDQFGEFGGGVVNMNSWDFPGKTEWNISMNTGIAQTSTFESFQTYQGGRWDFLGFDDGTRSMPDAIKNATSKITGRGMFSQNGYFPDELERLGESFDNNWTTSERSAFPDLNLSASLSDNIMIGLKPLGFLASVMYKSSGRTKEVERNIYKGGANGSVALQHHYKFNHYIQSATLGGITALRYDVSPGSRLTFNALVSRDAEDETRFFSGYNDDRQKELQDTRFRFIAQTTMSGQLAGQHYLSALAKSTFKWSASASRGLRDEPDTREVQYQKKPSESVYVLADESQSGSRIFNSLQDNSLNFSMDWTTPVRLNSLIKVGGATILRNRNSETRFFQFEPRDNINIDITQNPDLIFTAENIGMNGFMLREATRPTDSYEADQQLYAGYLMYETMFWDRLRFSGGARYEYSKQTVTSYELFSALQTPVVGTIETGDVLPGVSLTYAMTPNSNIRLAASQTVSRPDFRELSAFEFTDIIGGHSVIGNPLLKRALVRHLDVRVEQGTEVGNLRSVSLFYKYFDKPIETVIQATAQNRVSYENAKSAENFGVEFEVRQRLGDFHPALSPWAVSANLTLLNSDIQLSDSSKGIQTSSERPLYGQSPYLVNVSVSYKSPWYGTHANLYLHTFGERISEVGSKPLPDIYEMPHPDLDLTMQHPLGKGVTLKGAWKNILNSEIKYKQGNQYTERYSTGYAFSLGVAYNR